MLLLIHGFDLNTNRSDSKIWACSHITSEHEPNTEQQGIRLQTVSRGKPNGIWDLCRGIVGGTVSGRRSETRLALCSWQLGLQDTCRLSGYYPLYVCVCLKFSITQNKLFEMRHMNRQANAPSPVALPVTKHMLFGFVLPFSYKIEHSI